METQERITSQKRNGKMLTFHCPVSHKEAEDLIRFPQANINKETTNCQMIIFSAMQSYSVGLFNSK